MYHRQAVDIERDRVECTIVGPNNPSDQSVSPDNFLNQIMSVLKANNFAITGTETISGDCYLTTIQTLLQLFLYTHQVWGFVTMMLLLRGTEEHFNGMRQK